MKKAVNLIFPNQLFEESRLTENNNDIYLIEEYLFFKQYPFHKQKIAFHRASMKALQNYLEDQGKTVHYIEADNHLSDIRLFHQELQTQMISEVHIFEPTDDWLERRIQAMVGDRVLKVYDNPQFLNSKEELATFFKHDKKSFFQTTFYKQQRKKYNVLLDEHHKPLGGKWIYDFENRKKYPKNKTPPPVQFPDRTDIWDEAVDYTISQFGENPGNISKNRIYPITHREAKDWFKQFLTYRFYDFGIYEDAILKDFSIINHSVISPLINVGLLLPGEVVNRSIAFAEQENIPINSTEGFVRQIIGWREFIRGMYVYKGRFSRTRNFWNFHRRLPISFYNGTTGIYPVDQTIKKVLDTGYCHHIERLMILGNFMLLCEFNPDEVTVGLWNFS